MYIIHTCSIYIYYVDVFVHMFPYFHCSTSFSSRLTLLVFVFVAGSNHPTLFWALTQAPLPVSEKFMSCDSWDMGSPLKKIPRGFFQHPKNSTNNQKIKNKDPQPKRHCRKDDISIKNIPSMCVTVAPGLQSHVAVLVPKRLASWFRPLRSPSERLLTRKNRCIIFLYTYL